MEAKDTVRSTAILCTIKSSEYRKLGKGCPPASACESCMVETQAGISFKDGEKSGMEKVVEFIKDGGYLMGEEWQDQLKEWGLE